MTAFTELLTRHAPYTDGPNRLLCHECLDGRGHGEYTTTAAWVEHVVVELAAAGLRVTTRKPAKVAQPETIW
jgi:hypothetical protein